MSDHQHVAAVLSGWMREEHGVGPDPDEVTCRAVAAAVDHDRLDGALRALRYPTLLQVDQLAARARTASLGAGAPYLPSWEDTSTGVRNTWRTTIHAVLTGLRELGER